MMKPVTDVLFEFYCPIHTVDSDENVYQALLMLAEKDIGAMLVVKDGQVVGIFSERDYTRKVELEGRKAKSVKVKDVMTKKIICAYPDASPEDCLELMHANKIRHLPVIGRKGELLGFLSVLDVVKAVLNDKASRLSRLETYVSRSWPF